jgi:polysaccharide export outer membrane protein
MRTVISLVSVAFVLAAPLFLSNCAQNALQNSTVAAADKPAAATSSLALAAADAPTVDYKLAPRDIIDIAVFQVPDLTKTVQVSDDGNVFLPLIGKVAVVGKTTHEAEEIIAKKLRKGYLRAPQVSVFVKQYGQRVTVSGEVKTPRVLPVDGKITLTQAVADAGGFGDLADSKRVHVARTANQHIHDTIYDLDAVQAGKVPDPTLQGGDLVVVEQSGVKVTLKNLKDLLPFAIFAPLM